MLIFNNSWNCKKKSTDFQSKQERYIFNNPLFPYMNRYVFFIVIIFLSLLWLYTGFFIIEADEQGVILRFGKYNRIVAPGLNYKLPEPFEKFERVSVSRIKKETIGKMSNSVVRHNNFMNVLSNSVEERNLSYAKESHMLTGDENIIDMHYYIQWHVDNPLKFLFNIKHSESDNIVKISAESIMRQVIGKSTIKQALSEKRLDIEIDVKENLQSVLNGYSSGIKIVSVGILYGYVAPEVRDAYSDVQSAKADREKFRNQAKSYSNEILPQARGDAKAILQDAEAYREIIVRKAEGEANRFEEVLIAYRNSEEITRKRLYLDIMEYIYFNSNSKIIMDQNISKNILSILKLNS